MFLEEFLPGETSSDKGFVMTIRILIFSYVFFALPGFLQATPLEISGRFRNDFIVSKSTNNFLYANVLENRIVLTKKIDSLKFYTDFRLFHNSGEMAKYTNEITYSVPRAFIRYYSPAGFFTIGKTYVNFGTPGIFNPFEMTKDLNFNDLAYVKEGLLAFSYDFPFGDLSGGRIYFSPEDEVFKTGMSVFANVLGFDFGFVLNRKDRDKNITGIYFKGDLLVGINASIAYHFNDTADSGYGEGKIGIDYSFGSLYLSMDYYYNGLGATDVSAYDFSGNRDSYFPARNYLYVNLTYKADQFFSIQVNSFINLDDSSAIIMPGFDYLVSNGFTISFQASILTGSGAEEFSIDRYGDFSFIFRVELKL